MGFTERLEKLTHGQLVRLVDDLAASDRETVAPEIDKFLDAAEAPYPDAGTEYIMVQVTLPRGQEDERRLVSTARICAYEARGMTEEEAVRAAHDLQHGAHTGDVIYYDWDTLYDQDGEELSEEGAADGEARDPDQV